jgi:hypothetical protein
MLDIEGSERIVVEDVSMAGHRNLVYPEPRSDREGIGSGADGLEGDTVSECHGRAATEPDQCADCQQA